MRVRVDRRAVAQIGDRHEIGWQVATEQLTHVGAAAQAVIAGAALRRARHADAIADLHAPHFGSDGFDDADAAMALDQRHRHSALTPARPTAAGCVVAAAGGAGLDAEHGADVRITEIAGLGAHDHLAAADRPQPYILQRGAARPVPREIQARNVRLVMTAGRLTLCETRADEPSANASAAAAAAAAVLFFSNPRREMPLPAVISPLN